MVLGTLVACEHGRRLCRDEHGTVHGALPGGDDVARDEGRQPHHGRCGDERNADRALDGRGSRREVQAGGCAGLIQCCPMGEGFTDGAGARFWGRTFERWETLRGNRRAEHWCGGGGDLTWAWPEIRWGGGGETKWALYVIRRYTGEGCGWAVVRRRGGDGSALALHSDRGGHCAWERRRRSTGQGMTRKVDGPAYEVGFGGDREVVLLDNPVAGLSISFPTRETRGLKFWMRRRWPFLTKWGIIRTRADDESGV